MRDECEAQELDPVSAFQVQRIGPAGDLVEDWRPKALRDLRDSAGVDANAAREFPQRHLPVAQVTEEH